MTAAFIDSDENFMIYRRFGFLQARILLRKQDQLRELEEDLRRRDEFHSHGLDSEGLPKSQRLCSRAIDERKNDERIQLLDKIETKFNEYGEPVAEALLPTSY